MTLVELAVALAILGAAAGLVVPATGRVVGTLRAHGAAADLHGAVHLTRSRARATGVMHALVLEPGGRAFRIVEDTGDARRTVVGPTVLVDGAVASANTTIRFSPKGFAVPFGTITVRAGGEVRRIIVNLLGRVRMADGEAP